MDMTGAVVLGPEHYKSYHISAPTDTHWRDATCEEAGCDKFVMGFRTTVDETSPMGQFQADYIRHDRTRRHTEERDSMGMTVFTFPPGSNCFGIRHKKRIDRPEHFLILGGDRRGNPRQIAPQKLRPDQWVDSFAIHQDSLATAFKRG